jgi:hypothetical protein
MAYKLKELKRQLPSAARGDSKPVPRLRPSVAAELRRRLDEAEEYLVEDEVTPRSARTGRSAR